MPFLLFLRKIPWQAWALLGILIAFGFLRAHWIGVGVDRCEAKQQAAQEAADKVAKAQEDAAPVIAQEAIEAVKPKVIERVRIIRENIPVNAACPDYNDSVQSQVREAASAAD